ncbi:CIA30 family protein [Polaribacter sp.]|uniref:CIA30 family protein n=1 Tax=Polaribacter sp. TaxID=1920175 RepID=UPI0025D86CE3|nr:CIA30 family protein [Polaribacter sp.]
MLSSSFVLVDFSHNSNLKSWQIVDDVVMGGKSNGNFKINKNGNGFFYGSISLKNNGGFSSVRYNLGELDITPYTKIVMHVKGDGKTYQFRIKDDKSKYYSFVKQIKTTGDWEFIQIELKDLYPVFRGNRVNIENFSSNTLAQISFLFGNKKAESFQLEIDKIHLE